MIPFRSSQHIVARTAAVQRTITAAIALIVTANVAIAQHAQQLAPQQLAPQQPFAQQQQPGQPGPQPQQLQAPQQPAPGPQLHPQQQIPQYSQASAPQQPMPQQNPPMPNGHSAGQAAVAGPNPTFTGVTATTVTTAVAASSQISVCQEFHCEYVIDLLFRNQFRQQNGAFGAELAPGLVLSAPPSVNQPGDLELVNVVLLADASPTQGPVLEVVVRNQSQRSIDGFQISVVGVATRVHAQCPTARGLVSQLAAGSVGVFQLQLPATAVSNGPQGQQPVGFETFIVAVDSFDELMESNELNNVRIVRRAELLAMVAPPMTVAHGGPIGLNASPAPPADVALPSTPPVLSPLDSLMQEDSRLETTQPTAVGTMQILLEAHH